MGGKINFQNAQFIKSAVSERDFPQDNLPQIIMAGRSNVGKSSMINAVLNRKNFARTSSVPGKTAHINFFMIDKKFWLVDLPGYGYARVSNTEKLRWGMLTSKYFSQCKISKGILITDIRLRPTDDDIMMSDWFKKSNIPFIVAANKCDKISKSQINDSLDLISNVLDLDENTSVVKFSAKDKTGVSEIIGFISNI